MPVDAEQLYARDRTGWRAWLERNAGTSPGVWPVYDKGPERLLGYDDIVEEALRFGWVDSRPGRVDERRSKLYVLPGGPPAAGRG